MKKEIKKLTKTEKEKIDNRLLVIFTVAVASIMVLLYLMNWFQGSIGFQRTAEVAVYVFFALFIYLIVHFKRKENKCKKENLVEKAQSSKNWFTFSIVGAVVAFLVYPRRLFTLLHLNIVNEKVVDAFRLFGMSAIATRCLLFVALIAVYTIVMFIYWGTYMSKCHKSSLNKGKK